MPSFEWCQQVEELQEQVHQLESRLSTVQVALRQAQAKAPSQTQHFTASLSSHSPSQSLHASPGAQGGHKKARSEQTQLTPRQSVAAQDADTISAGRLSSGAAPQFSNDHAASQSGAFGLATCTLLEYGWQQATEGKSLTVNCNTDRQDISKLHCRPIRSNPSI